VVVFEAKIPDWVENSAASGGEEGALSVGSSESGEESQKDVKKKNQSSLTGWRYTLGGCPWET